MTKKTLSQLMVDAFGSAPPADDAPAFPVETFQDFGYRPGYGHGWLPLADPAALARAMTEAENPWTVLGSPEARRALAVTWARAQRGGEVSTKAMSVFLALLAPKPRRGRPRKVKPHELEIRKDTASVLEALTRAIIAGEVNDSTYAVGWVLSVLGSEEIDAKTRSLVTLPPPTGPKARGEARDRAARVLVAVYSALEKTHPDESSPERWHVLEKWRTDKMPTKVRRTASSKARMRLSRARRPVT